MEPGVLRDAAQEREACSVNPKLVERSCSGNLMKTGRALLDGTGRRNLFLCIYQ